MKAMKLFLLVTFLAVASSQAQVSVNINIGTPPVWAPAAPVEVNYYYLPDIEVYYDVPARCYIYLSHGRWCHSAALPSHCRGYDLHHGRIIYLDDYRGNKPYVYYKEHRKKYKGNCNWKTDDYYGDDNRGNGHGNGHREGHGKGHGHGHGHGHED